jgi:hypothetical protein
MYSEDDIQYALETTEVIHEPDRRIDTFGSTSFEFTLLTELMDDVTKVRERADHGGEADDREARTVGGFGVRGIR